MFHSLSTAKPPGYLDTVMEGGRRGHREVDFVNKYPQKKRRGFSLPCDTNDPARRGVLFKATAQRSAHTRCYLKKKPGYVRAKAKQPKNPIKAEKPKAESGELSAEEKKRRGWNSWRRGDWRDILDSKDRDISSSEDISERKASRAGETTTFDVKKFRAIFKNNPPELRMPAWVEDGVAQWPRTPAQWKELYKDLKESNEAELYEYHRLQGLRRADEERKADRDQKLPGGREPLPSPDDVHLGDTVAVPIASPSKIPYKSRSRVSERKSDYFKTHVLPARNSSGQFVPRRDSAPKVSAPYSPDHSRSIW